jgi:phosphonate transport system permease protein
MEAQVAMTDASIKERYPAVFRQSVLNRFLPLIIIVGTILYLCYAVWFFALPSVIGGARWDRAGNLLAQWISYDVFVEFRLDGETVVPKYPRFTVLGDNPAPGWIIHNQDGSTTVDIDGPGSSTTFSKSAITVTHAGETVVAHRGEPPRIDGEAPAWLTIKGTDVIADFGFAGDVRISPERVKISKRFLGWANFVFDTYSPYFGKSPGEVWSRLWSPERLDPKMSNLELALDNIWYNSQWQHGDVWVKLLQTIVMAFVGTLFGALIAFPLAFLAARNIMSNGVLNHTIKRCFDFLRSVDMLIWALFFTRAFGPGPLAGIGAIFLTETGTLGKIYSEGLENIDDNQREGIKSTGANPLQVQRYGVVPQVLPVVISQTLYQWESNTRSATIIGAVGAGGIGLKLWEAMRTNSNWANVFYMVILILIVVFVFDSISNALRSRLIGPKS